eukprot:CAMPEP_0116963206 /NCGR_PEP_ID=MMETSP0467-20121206/47759_1 /TAXON_ID=283647 /ORGANISM="Mesodinium pulex, Strain SPMC105" /LENGTH=156 /DNA_ID=CAMNT_0004651763 /DNA_START=412 /DNA_END=882 /DNA_ORIENTATION=-
MNVMNKSIAKTNSIKRSKSVCSGHSRQMDQQNQQNQQNQNIQQQPLNLDLDNILAQELEDRKSRTDNIEADQVEQLEQSDHPDSHTEVLSCNYSNRDDEPLKGNTRENECNPNETEPELKGEVPHKSQSKTQPLLNASTTALSPVRADGQSVKSYN